MNFLNLFVTSLFAGLLLSGCVTSPNEVQKPFSGPSPWPQIRKERIQQLLPGAMERAGVDVWLVVCRENNNDPLADHIGGENASGTAVFLFQRRDSSVYSIAFSPVGEATALKDVALHDSVAVIPRGESAIAAAGAYVQKTAPNVIAVNMSDTDEMADGLSFTQHKALTAALGKTVSARLVSSAELVYEWLSIKLPAEVEIMAKAAEITAQWQLEAYASIVPGKTTDADVAKFLKKKMADAGLEDAWAADQNPNVVSGADRGHSHATDRVIQPGDVIQTDFGIKVYGRWVTDIQRFAYVLKPGETKAPDDVQMYWDVAKKGSRLVLEALKPGVAGFEVDKKQRDWMKENGSLPVMWSTGHPVGYVAHDVGPGLGGAQEGRTPNAAQRKPIRAGMVFAYDGFYCWPRPDGTTKTISVEEMAVVTETGAHYLTRPQEDLFLVGKR
jgi:Xaa-Pro aminopeptidase